MYRTGRPIRVPAAPALFLISIVITLLFWLALPADYKVNESSDYWDHYEPTARGILAGENIASTTRTPPGYPLLLASLFALAGRLTLDEDAVLSAFTLLCVGSSTVLIFFLARSTWGMGPALVSAVVWMTYPFSLWLTKQPNGEVPFGVALYAGFALCWYAVLGRRRAWLLCLVGGVFFGVAMMIRPIGIGLGLVVGAIVGLAKTDVPPRARLICAGMVLLGNLVVTVPWEVAVYERTGRIISLGTGGTGAIHDGLTFAVRLRGFRMPGGVPADVLKLMEDVSARRAETDSLGGIITVMSNEFWKRPLATAKLLGLKVVRSWYGTDSRRFEFEVMLVQIPYLILLLWSTWEAWRSGGTARKLAMCIWIVGLYFWAMTIIAVSMLRYMTPAIGLLCVLLAAGVASLASSRRLSIARAAPIT